MKRIVSIQDISCLGKCSLTVALPILSAMGVAMAAEGLGPEARVSAQELAPVYLRLSQAERERLARLGSLG